MLIMSTTRDFVSLPSPTQAEPTRPRLRFRRPTQFIREVFETVVLIVVLYALVNLSTARFVVEGASMQPNFATGQYLIVSRMNYLFGDPQHGDIVVFHYPGHPVDDYIKRVIGVPGDTIEIRDALIYRNGERLDEPYINEPCSQGSCRDNVWEIGENEYFVMGDNRNHSSDSRAFGPVSREFIVGEALVRYWPPRDWSIMPGAQ